MGLKHRRLLAGALACVLALCAFSAGAETKKKFQTASLDLFDTFCSVIGYEETEEAFQSRAAEIFAELEEYDHLYDIYGEYPGLVNLCTINSHPGEVFQVDPRIIGLLQFAAETDEFTGHRVDAMFGAVLRLWHEAREQGLADPEHARLPETAALTAAAEHTGFDRIEIDPEAGTVRLLDPEASLDVGAVAKGYAGQRVAENLPEGYVLSLGGNLVMTGPKPEGKPWVMGIQDPWGDTGAYVQRVKMEKGALVTSGDYQRQYTVDGVKYNHIIDPETLFPGTRWTSVTVIAEDSGLADALSTALFLTDREEGQRLLDLFGAKAVWITEDKQLLYSDGCEALLY